MRHAVPEPPNLVGEDHPLFKLARYLISNWRDHAETLHDPLTLGTVALGGAAAYGTARGVRAAGRHLDARPGDTVIGRRIDRGRDLFLRKELVARWVSRTHHFELVGPTGSGKTTALLPMAVQDLRNRHNVVAVEIYGDFGTTLPRYALAIGRPVLLFDPSVPGALKINPLAGEGDEEVVERFVSVVEGVFSHHPFFGPFNGDAARAFARLAREYARSRGLEADIGLFANLLTDRGFLERILAVRKEDEGRYGRRAVGARYSSRLTRAWFDSEYLRWSERVHVEYLSGLKNFVRKLLATEAARNALCPGPGDRTLDLEGALSMGGVLVVLRVPVDAVGEEPAYAIARYLTRTLQALTLARGFSGEPVPPVCLYLDELPTLVGGSVGDAQSAAGWMALVRKKNVAVTVAYQGGALVSEVLEGALDTNARSKLFAGGLGAEDARRVQRTLGFVEKEVEDERVSRGSVLAPQRTTFSRGRRTAQQPRFTEEEIRFLRMGEWLYLPFEGRRQRPPVKVRIPRVPPPERFISGLTAA